MFIIWFAHGRGLHVLNCVDCDQELRNFSYFCQLGIEPFGIFLCADLHWGMLLLFGVGYREEVMVLYWLRRQRRRLDSSGMNLFLKKPFGLT